MASPAEAAIAVGDRFGRYFNLVSFVPSLALVVWSWLLISSHPWQGHPDLTRAFHTLAHTSLAGAAWLTTAALGIALFVHPLQFATIQLMEGYWGASRSANAIASARTLMYRQRLRASFIDGQCLQEKIDSRCDQILKQNYSRDSQVPEDPDDDELPGLRQEVLDAGDGDNLVPALIARQALARQAETGPEEGHRVMPTRLGNALRRFEDLAGSQYGLDAVSVAPHLHFVIPDRHVTYLRDSRQGLDTSVRLCAMSLIATAVTSALLLVDGLWILLSVGPYALAYIAYRGAVAAAEDYGVAFTTIVDLDRFALYDALRVGKPANTAAERKLNADLMRLLSTDGWEVTMSYPPNFRGIPPAKKRGSAVSPPTVPQA